jgi:putative Ca2+/H+ antiporter (TMEM165/GDT1 family)
MMNSREKKRLGRMDVFIIILISVVWTVEVYKFATAGIPMRSLNRFNAIMLLVLGPIIVWQIVKKVIGRA